MQAHYERLGGGEVLRKMVDRFYDLMDLEPNYTALRAAHPGPFDNARQRLFWFLCGLLGGPQYYTERVGQPMLKMRHMPEQTGGGPIGIKERDQWLACMDQAMVETGVGDDLRTRLNASFFQTADWMRNRA